MAADILISFAVIALGIVVAYRCILSWGVDWRLPCFSGERETPGPQEGKSPMGKVFLLALCLRLLILGAAVTAVLLRGEGGGSFRDCLGQMNRWDAGHYIALVEKGYAGYVENGEHLFLVFFPGYVWLTRLVTLILPDTTVAGMAVSNLCFSAGCCYVYRLAEETLGRRAAWDAVLLLSLFPFSFFSSLVMTEGLFLLTTAASCYYAYKGKWLAYGLWGCGAALTRMAGVLVVIPAAVALLEQAKPLRPPVRESLKGSWKGILKRIPLLLLPLLGTGIYLALNYRVDGDPFAFTVHQEHWHQGGMWVSRTLQYVWSYFWENAGNSFGWAVWAPTLFLFVAFFALIAVSAGKLRNLSGLLAYAFCYLIVNYSLSWLLSAGRYLSCGFPFFILLAGFTEKRPVLRSVLLSGEALFLGVYLFAYLSGAQVM